ncbi:MAG: LysR family transcriptional regulator [Gammaproteobacteria bacterium]|nr:MAG: LysR family transcriptional regulator [Gammaproteobacteria bacterium]
MPVDTLTSIKVFRQVVESGSFVSAADRLDLSPAMVSKHVMQVEKRLGVRLLNRNSRTLSLTEPGRVYFERCKTILDDLEETELELGSLGTAPRGTLRITCPSWFASQRVADMLAQFRSRFPEIVIDISFEDRTVDLVDEGYDLGMRVARNSGSLGGGLIARPLCPISFVLAASREYLKRRGIPKSPDDLAHHDSMAVANIGSWTLNGPDGQVEVPVRAVQRYRSAVGLAHAVAAGVGLAPLPTLYFDDPVFKSVLVPVLTDYPLREATIYLVYASRKYVPLKLRAFIDFIVEHVSRLPSIKVPEVVRAAKGPDPHREREPLAH